MTELPQKDRDIIAKYPLGNAFDQLQESLRKAEKSYDSELELSDHANNASDQGLQEVVSELLHTLVGHKATRELRSNIGPRNVRAELATIHGRVESGDFQYTHYRTLLRRIIDKEPDINIWIAVLNLIKDISRETPVPKLPMIPPSFDGTPITHSSASLKGSQQTREHVWPRIFEEISSCTYRDVDGFFATHFERPDWVKQADRILRRAKARYSNGRWIGFPDPPKQNHVLEWLFQFQTDFLRGMGGTYHTSYDRSLPGSRAIRCPDLLVKKVDASSESLCDWKDVRVIGELKESQESDKNLLIQLASYVREVFAKQPTRRFVHGFTIRVTRMQLWIFDRSGPYCCSEFDIHEQPDKFVRALAGYLLMSDEELGLDTFIKRRNDKMFITVTDSQNGGKKELELSPEPIAYQSAIVCRGTTCYLAKTVGTNEWEHVVKFSWRSGKRRAEGDLLKLAQERKVEGVAALVAHEDLLSIKDIRDGMQFKEVYKYRIDPRSTSSSFIERSRLKSLLTQSFNNLRGLGSLNSSSRKRGPSDAGGGARKRSRSDSKAVPAIGADEVEYDVEGRQKTSLVDQEQSTFANRIFCYLVISPPGRPLREFKSVEELLEAFRDAIRAHRSLYERGQILHRDISENNVIITDGLADGKPKGMLIDLDLAKERDSGPSGARHMTGTLQFMAIEVLQEVSHTYRHDLESFFYVFLWTYICHGWVISGKPMTREEPHLLRRWYTGNYEDIARAKVGDMDRRQFEGIIAEFPPTFTYAKDVARKVRDVLFPIRGGALFTGTPSTPELLYDPMIDAFDDGAKKARETTSTCGNV